MSKGYFVIKPIVFHNQQSKEQFLIENQDYLHFSRKDIMQLYKRFENKEIECKSCNQKHIVGKIQWSKF